VLSLPVLALVPMIASKQDRRRRQLGGIAANVAAAVALLGSMAILVVWRLHS
jgi:sugar/nucleoside kinase (ribokinase family)